MDSHNKSRQSYLALEKFWVTKCVWLWLCTTVAVVMTITNLWKLFRYGVKRYHYEKLIGIREFSEQLALDFFKNNFSTDTGTPAKNITPLDEVDEGEKFSTFRSLHFYIYAYPSKSVRTISYIALNSDSSLACTSVTYTIEYHHTFVKE